MQAVLEHAVKGTAAHSWRRFLEQEAPRVDEASEANELAELEVERLGERRDVDQAVEALGRVLAQVDVGDLAVPLDSSGQGPSLTSASPESLTNSS